MPLDLIFVIARDRHDLYRHLRREFADEETVQVIMDRRVRDRRRLSKRVPLERRRAGRRRAQDRESTGLGWTLVRLSDPSGTPRQPPDVLDS